MLVWSIVNQSVATDLCDLELRSSGKYIIIANQSGPTDLPDLEQCWREVYLSAWLGIVLVWRIASVGVTYSQCLVWRIASVGVTYRQCWCGVEPVLVWRRASQSIPTNLLELEQCWCGKCISIASQSLPQTCATLNNFRVKHSQSVSTYRLTSLGAMLAWTASNQSGPTVLRDLEQCWREL